MARIQFATVWLSGGCSGCHMSLLDLDEWLFTLAEQVDVVYSPLVDVKEYPEAVDVVLVEGAVANAADLHHIQQVRARSKVLVAFGDCAVTANVAALRNPLGRAMPCLERSYLEAADCHPHIPDAPDILPPLLDRVVPVHNVVPVDVYLPGCPPPADRIRAVLESLLVGQMPHLEGEQLKFG